MTQTLTATQWIDTCSTSEIDEEDVMRWDHGGRTFAIYHSPDGEFFATDGLCTHENVHLAGGLVMDHVQRLEAIGCFGAELEVVSDRLGEWTSRNTAMLMLTLGAGAQYLFAEDVLGYTRGRKPRPVKTYRDFRAEYHRPSRRAWRSSASSRPTQARVPTRILGTSCPWRTPSSTASWQGWTRPRPMPPTSPLREAQIHHRHDLPLAACAEMLWRDRPVDWIASRLHEMGFGVGLWNGPEHDLAALGRTYATFTIINGSLRGRLTDDEGAAERLATARETAPVGKRLSVHRLNLHGTARAWARAVVTGPMWLKARDTLLRIVDLAEEEGVTFTLENLNLPVDHPGVPFGRAADTRALVASIDHPRLRLNLDLHHVQIGEGNQIEPCRRALPWISEIQVADVLGRMEPGTGEVNWPGVAKALAAMGYTGPIGLESRASRDPEAALEAFRAAFTVAAPSA